MWRVPHEPSILLHLERFPPLLYNGKGQHIPPIRNKENAQQYSDWSESEEKLKEKRKSAMVAGNNVLVKAYSITHHFRVKLIPFKAEQSTKRTCVKQRRLHLVYSEAIVNLCAPPPPYLNCLGEGIRISTRTNSKY